MDKRGLVALAAAALGTALLLAGCVGPNPDAVDPTGSGSPSAATSPAEAGDPTGTAAPGATGTPAPDAVADPEPEPLSAAEQQGEQSDPGGADMAFPDDNPAVAQTRFLDAVRPAWNGETPPDERLLELAGSVCQQVAAGSAVEEVVAVVGDTDDDLANNALIVQQATAIVCPA